MQHATEQAQQDREVQIIRLYEAMPGAPMPPKEDGYYLWGDVEGNDYWRFCEAVVDMMTATAQAYAR